MKMNKNVRNKKKLKNELPDEFIIDNAILEQNPNLINVQDVEQKILKIFKSNLTNSINNKDDSLKFEDNESEGSQVINLKNPNTNGRLFETFKISKKARNKLKSKTNTNNIDNFSQINNYLMNNNLPSNFFDQYLSMANNNPNFQSPKNMNNNLLSLFGMPMETNPAISNELLGLLFQQYQQNNNMIDNNQINFGYNPMIDSTNLLGMPLNLNLPQVSNQLENLNSNLPNFNSFNNNNNNKNEIENFIKMIYNNQQVISKNDNDQQINDVNHQKINSLQNINNIMNNTTTSYNESKSGFLNQKRGSSFNYNDPHFLYELENLGEKNDTNVIPNNNGNNNLNNLDFHNFLFESKFLQNNPNFNIGMNSMNPLLNEKLSKCEFPNMMGNDNNLNENFPIKLREMPDHEPLENNKNNIDLNQLLVNDPNIFFNFNSNSNNPNLFFESILYNMCNNSNAVNSLNQMNSNIFDLDSKNLLSNNNVNNNQHPNQ